MVTAEAVLYGNRDRVLGFDRRESIRSGSSSAAAIRASSPQAAQIGADYGYDEINLNIGCPVGSRAIGTVRRLPDGRARSRRANA